MGGRRNSNMDGERAATHILLIIYPQIHTHIQHTVSEESDGSMLVRKKEEYAE